MAARFKIAQLVPYYSPVIGGVEVVCQYISEELVRRGHEVHVFTANRNHKGSPRLSLERNEIINGVNVHRYKSYVDVGHFGFFPGFIPALKSGAFDLIHTHGYRQPQSELASRIGHALNIPVIMHIHGGFYTQSRLKRLVYAIYDNALRRDGALRFDYFIVLSDADRENVLNLNVDAGRIAIIRNAAERQAFESIDPAPFRSKHDLTGKALILYLGILHGFKRPDLLMQSLPEIIKHVPNAMLLFVGPDGGQLQTIQALGDRLGLAPYYKWLGPLRGHEKHEALACAAFLALPSDEDPYPLVLLEAMAHGKPVLTTSAVGQAETVAAHSAGIVVAPGDQSAIEAAAIRLLNDSEYRAELGHNVGQLAKAMFSVPSVVNEIEALYVQVAEAKLAGRRHGRDS